MFDGIRRVLIQQPIVMMILLGSSGYGFHRLYLNWNLHGVANCEAIKIFIICMAIAAIVVGVNFSTYRRPAGNTQYNNQPRQ